MGSCIENWEQDYRHYAERTGDKLSDNMRRATLQGMCPDKLSDHIDLNIYRLTTYDDLKREIERYLEQAARTGPVPMEIGSFTGDWKGWKGKNKGKDPKGEGKGDHTGSKGSSGNPTSGSGGGKGNGKTKFQ